MTALVPGDLPAALDLSPHAEPRPWPSRVLRQGGQETRSVLRNGEQLLVGVVLPGLVLVGLLRVPSLRLGPGPRTSNAVAGVLALAVVSTAFTGQAIVTGFDRRYGVLRLLGTTPLGRSGLIAGKALAVLAVLAVQTVLLSALATALGWRPALSGSAVAAAVLAVVLGAAAFTALALLVAGTLRAEAVLAVANLVWVLLLAGGGLVLPAGSLPHPLALVVEALPSGALGTAMRQALGAGRTSAVPLLVLGGWAVLASGLAARWFRWD